MVTVPDVLYICDHRACERCNGIEGCYTTDISHAVNFVKMNDFYYEKEPIMAEIETMPNTDDLVMRVETREISSEEANEMHKKELFARRRTKQFYELIKTIFSICNLSGFRVEGHIRIKDLKTGKVYE